MDKVTTMSDELGYQFANCGELIESDIRKLEGCVATFGTRVFNNCKKLTRYDLRGVTYLEREAFKGCPLVYCGDTSAITSIGSNCFAGCLIEGELNLSSLVDINSYVFSETNKITKFLIGPNFNPRAVHGQFNSSAETCEFIMSARADESYKWSMGSYNFSGSAILTKVVFSQALATFDVNNFYNVDCPIVLPETITLVDATHLGSNYKGSRFAFYIKATTPPTCYSLPSTVPIHIPKGTLEAYSSATGWSKYASRLVEYDFGADPDNINQYCV